MQKIAIPTSRAYTHDRCQQQTLVGDSAFSNMSSPLSDIALTYCSSCKGMFGVDEFAWSDTGENLVDYRQRHAGHAGALSRFLCSRNAVLVVLFLGIVLGLVAAAVLSPIGDGILGFVFTTIGAGLLILFVLAAILISVVTPIVHRQVCGVSDPRALR